MTVAFVRWPQRRHDPDAIHVAGRIAMTIGNAITIGNDVIAPPLGEAFDLLRGEPATTALQVEHQQMIMEPALCACVNARMR